MTSRGRRSRRRCRCPAVAAIALLALAGCGAKGSATSASLARPQATASATSPRSAPSDGEVQQWPSYHYQQARTAQVPANARLDRATVAWRADLGAAVYGQPLVAGGRVVAATERNRVVALDPTDGSLAWSVSLGRPLTNVRATVGCGNIDPLGITSTPVIDTKTGVVYVVGEVSDGHGSVHHQLEGIDIDTGKVTLSVDADPPLPGGERAAALLQRASLALGGGRVYVAYGGNAGDCGTYHGWVVAVEVTNPAQRSAFEVAPGGAGGAIWESGGAPAIDTDGNVYVSTGNANPFPALGGPDREKYTESVLKLSPDLTPLASFKDITAGGDQDLATGNPVLLPGNRLFAVGKTDIGYVLRRGDLSKIAAIPGICGTDPDGGPAYDAATDRVFVPCRGGGIQVVNLSTQRVGPKLVGPNSAPILIGRRLWALAYPDGTLTEFDIDSGRTVQTLALGTAVPHFASPSTALGLLLVPTTSGVVALRGQ